MYPKRSSQDGPNSRPVRTSDRIKTRPTGFGRSFMYYSPNLRHTRKSKIKTRTAASQIAKLLRPGNRKAQDSNTNVSFCIWRLRIITAKRIVIFSIILHGSKYKSPGLSGMASYDAFSPVHQLVVVWISMELLIINSSYNSSKLEYYFFKKTCLFSFCQLNFIS